MPKRAYDSNFHSWWAYTGTYRLTDRLSIHAEAQARRHDFVKDWQQWFVRPALNYHLNGNVSFSAGYLYAITYPYGEFPAKDDFPEHRAYEQMQLQHKENRFAFTHRYRLEQRWVRPALSNDFVYTNRMRYLFRTNIPLTGTAVEAHTPYLLFYNEVFLNFGKNVQQNVFDQNRLSAGMGYRFSKSLALEVSYLNQFVQRANGYQYENNHTLLVGLVHNIDFRGQ